MDDATLCVTNSDRHLLSTSGQGESMRRGIGRQHPVFAACPHCAGRFCNIHGTLVDEVFVLSTLWQEPNPIAIARAEIEHEPLFCVFGKGNGIHSVTGYGIATCAVVVHGDRFKSPRIWSIGPQQVH